MYYVTFFRWRSVINRWWILKALKMPYIKIITMAFVMAGLCAFIIGVGSTSGALQKLQERTPSWMPFGCNFCLGFWLSVLFSILAFRFIEPFTWPMILVPILSTAINRILTK